MGMSSSQARLLSLTARMHDIEYKAQRIEAQKLQLANDSSRVYEDYLRALDATKIQYKSIDKDGSIIYNDATLNALENGVVPSYTGLTSSKTFLLYDNVKNKILITPSFANEFGITDSTVQELGTLDEWLYAHGCTKAPVPDTYSVTNGLSNVENVQTGSSYYVSSGVQPSVSHSNPYTEDITDFTDILKNTDSNKTYTISTADELKKLATLINSNGAETDGVNIILTNNIEIPSGWESINEFRGTFNGNGYTISGLDNALFSTLSDGANVTNLSISGANINNSSVINVGILANKAHEANISNIKITNSSVSGEEVVGGLVGYANNNTVIKNCLVDATVSGTGKDVGGLIGNGESITVESCMAKGNVTGLRRVGGFIGCLHNSTIKQSKADCTTYATTTSSAEASDAGGFIGSTYGSTIEHCESAGTVKSNKNWSVGGFVGTTGGNITADLLTINYCNSSCSLNFVNPITSTDLSGKAFGSFIGDGKGATIKNSNSYNNLYDFIGISKNNGVLAQITNCYQDGQIKSNEGEGSYTAATSPISGAGATSYSAPNLQHNATPTSYTKVDNIPLTTYMKGTLNVNGSDDELVKYIAFKLGGSDNYQTNYEYIQNRGFDTYKLAELVELVNSGRYSDKNSLVSNLTNKYNSTDYNLTHNDTISYNVSQRTNPDVKDVEVSSVNDIQNRLAFDIYNKNGEGDISQIKSQINGAFTNNELASLSYYYGKSEWNTIVNNLATSVNKSIVSEYVNRYDSSWTINYSSTDKVNITTISHPDEWVKDENYYTQYNKYYELKSLQGYNFEIIDEDLCSITDFVGNYINEGGASLLEFNLDVDESFNLVDTSVATDTSLQEIANEKELKKAEAKYEADMKRIDMKDRKYDAELAKFETERNAVKQEMETLKTVAKDNVDRTFKLFS